MGTFMSSTKSKAMLQMTAVSKGLVAIAAVGWGLFAYSAISLGSVKQAAQDEIARLRLEVETGAAARNKLAQDRAALTQASGNLQQLRKQIATATQELQRLDTMRARVSEAIDRAHSQRVASAAPSADKGESPPSAAPAAPPVTGNETIPSASPAAGPLSKQQIRAAQEALTGLGYGALKADGVLGPGTSRAVEAFERAKGLPVTGQLGAATLQALKTHLASAVQ
ncbi:peptidoglycan-binding protein [Microvirga arabica]|uniref:Peptidoglycan-binding protein n=1 Tax=Microvirga arabica TaxID=1128671 RepID=A0ABV6Y3P1_9HYPH